MENRYFKDVQKIIETEISSKQPSLLYDPIVYSLSQKANRIRSGFTLIGCEMFGGNMENALYPAVGIEIFHNSILMHDDIIDKSPVRRGQPSVYTKWDENTAILSGDAMFALANIFMRKTDLNFIAKIMDAFTRITIGVCEGQRYDLDFETQRNVTIAEYLEMIRLKKAILLGGALEIGGIIGDASEQDLQHLRTFGENIGIAFQLQDDWLDMYGDTEKLGKIRGGDIAANKKTFLYLKALELASEEQAIRLRHYISPINFDPIVKFNAVSAVYNELNVGELTKAEMQKYQALAMDAWAKISVSEQAKQPLKEHAETLLKRHLS